MTTIESRTNVIRGETGLGRGGRCGDDYEDIQLCSQTFGCSVMSTET